MGEIGDLTGIMREVLTLSEKVHNVELTGKLQALQLQMFGLIEERGEMLKESIALQGERDALRQQLERRESLRYRKKAYWLGLGETEQDGPLCSACFDKGGNLVRMHPGSNGYAECPVCKTIAQVWPERERRVEQEPFPGYDHY